MRARLVGWAGDRPPVPGTEPVEPIDPNPDPPLDPDDPSIPDPLVLVLEDGVPFLKATYQALGYNRFDVICIGGGGGRGSGYHQVRGSGIKQGYGGGGGGGGLHRIKGRLALLPPSVAVLVGAAGADGAFSEVSDPAANPLTGLVKGGDGGVSSFGGVICRASGGVGGGPATAFHSPGGDGGVGNAELAGGGAGGAPGTAYTPGSDGSWNGVIGKGGGGGSGGAIQGSDNPFNAGDVWTTLQLRETESTPGGKGSYSSGDPTTSGPGDGVASIGATLYHQGEGVPYYGLGGDFTIIPGAGGGAKSFALNGDNEEYGSNGPGLVIIRLTYIIT